MKATDNCDAAFSKLHMYLEDKTKYIHNSSQNINNSKNTVFTNST